VKFANDKTGWKLASSVGGTVLGERGSRIILDDPNSTSDIESDATRYRTELFFSEVLPDRLGNLEEDAIVIIIQRLHERDVSGVALDREMGYLPPGRARPAPFQSCHRTTRAGVSLMRQ
jgi:hypothetical protein